MGKPFHGAGPALGRRALRGQNPHGPASFGAYGLAIDIVNGQWEYQRAGGNPGVGANWSIYPNTGWVAVTLINRDTDALLGLLGQQTRAITGAAPGGGGGG